MLRTKKEGSADFNDEPLIKLSDSQRQLKIKYEKQTLEAEILENDTIHSIAIRNNCSVSDIKKLNKILQDNEIHAFKVIKVPLTAHNILVDTIPKVHKSGNNSPKIHSSTPLPNKEKLEEKLLLASVSNAVIKTNEFTVIKDDANFENELSEDLLSREPLLKETNFRGYPRTIKLPKNDFLSFNGSDCELSWVFLLIVILSFCVIIPLIYVYVLYEHPEKFNHSHSKYDDPELHYRVHIDDGKNNTLH